MRASRTARGQDETDDEKYLSWKLWTESDMTTIVLPGNKTSYTPSHVVLSAHNESQRL